MFLFASCSVPDEQKGAPVDLIGTTWKCEIADGCINVYDFETDSIFKFFSCEMEDEYYGSYYFKDGFLMLDQKGSIYDESFPESSIHRAERRLYRVDIKGQEFKHLSMSDWVNDKWVQSDFKFDESYVYRKMK